MSMNGTPGSAVIYPEIESVRGDIVVHAAFHEYMERLGEPFRLKVDGRVRELEVRCNGARQRCGLCRRWWARRASRGLRQMLEQRPRRAAMRSEQPAHA